MLGYNIFAIQIIYFTSGCLTIKKETDWFVRMKDMGLVLFGCDEV